jgi:hypothetical protein
LLSALVSPPAAKKQPAAMKPTHTSGEVKKLERERRLAITKDNSPARSGAK